MDEYVVLVNEKNEVIGTRPKLEIHSNNTPLHRGFSVYIFDNYKNLLLQRRSEKKKTWPLVWSNSCCGHPKLNETVVDAARRRLKFELGIEDPIIKMVLPDYRYKFEKDGIVENELCPVMIAHTKQKPRINHDEVEEIRWIDWAKWIIEVKTNETNYSPWCVEQTLLLSKLNLKL